MARILTDKQRQLISARIAEARDRKGLGNERLATLARLSERTIRTVVAGDPARFHTYDAVCQAVGLHIDDLCPPEARERASAEFGDYTRTEVEKMGLIGLYEGIRRRYDRRPELVRSMFEFEWHGSNGRLWFKETRLPGRDGGKDYNSFHQGNVYVSRSYQMLHLLVRDMGALRLTTLRWPEVGRSELRGCVLTQAARRLEEGGPVVYLPGVSPLLLRRLPDQQSDQILSGKAVAQNGWVGREDPAYAELTRTLSEIERHHLALATGGMVSEKTVPEKTVPEKKGRASGGQRRRKR